MSFNFVKACKPTRVSASEAAAQTAVNSDGVDMKGFKSACFMVAMGAITAGGVQSAKLQQSSDDASTDAYSDLEGTSVSIADDDDDQVVLLEVDSPLKRYVRCVVSRATQDSVVDGIFAFQYNASEEPVSHDSTTVVDTEYHLGPAEGTA